MELMISVVYLILAIAILGAVFYLIGLIPMLSEYQATIKVIAIVALVLLVVFWLLTLLPRLPKVLPG